jgi:glutathione S-transferase
MTRYRLHYFPESGNSYKLALMLTLCGQPFEPVWTDFGGGVTRSAAWRASVNPMGEIPVLEEDGVGLTQTGPILLRLSERYGRFGGRDERERFMAAYRYRRAFTPSPNPQVQAYLRKRIDDFLGIIEREVQDRPFIIGDHPTVADLSMCGYLIFPSQETGYDLAAQFPSVDAWLQRIAALPGWQGPYDLLPGRRLRSFV